MIGMIQGDIITRQPPILTVMVNGMGYEVLTPMTTFYSLAADTTSITLHTHLAIREDQWQLYGFVNTTDKTLFKMLIKVNGIGPKVALSMLSAMPSEHIASAILSKDAAQLVRIPGIGKKTVERLLLEMQEPLRKLAIVNTEALPALQQDSHEDAIEALIALGYRRNDAQKTVKKIIEEQPDIELSAMIRLSLQTMTNK